MTYYETLVDEINRSMKKNPRSAMIMDMGNFEIIAKAPNLKSLSEKVPGLPKGTSTVIFQKRNQKAAWIL